MTTTGRMDLPPSATRALIFDCDGLLVDTQACWDAAFSTCAAEFGLHLTAEHLRQLRGFSAAAAAAFIAGRADKSAGGPESTTVERRINARLLAAIDDADLRALPGVEETLDRHRGLPRAVASNAPREV